MVKEKSSPKSVSHGFQHPWQKKKNSLKSNLHIDIPLLVNATWRFLERTYSLPSLLAIHLGKYAGSPWKDMLIPVQKQNRTKQSLQRCGTVVTLFEELCPI